MDIAGKVRPSMHRRLASSRARGEVRGDAFLQFRTAGVACVRDFSLARPLRVWYGNGVAAALWKKSGPSAVGAAGGYAVPNSVQRGLKTLGERPVRRGPSSHVRLEKGSYGPWRGRQVRRGLGLVARATACRVSMGVCRVSWNSSSATFSSSTPSFLRVPGPGGALPSARAGSGASPPWVAR